MGMAMAIGARSAMKKSLLLILILFPLVITVADCAKDIPASVNERPQKYCGDQSKRWHGGLCIKAGVCDQPCREEGYDSGYCGIFPFMTTCCCLKKCPSAAPGQFMQPLDQGNEHTRGLWKVCYTDH